MAFPLHTRLVNALTKAGATVTNGANDKWIATKGDRRVEWFTQQGYPDKDKLRAVCICTPSPYTDVMTDCFCDTFHHTIKSAVAAVN